MVSIGGIRMLNTYEELTNHVKEELSKGVCKDELFLQIEAGTEWSGKTIRMAFNEVIAEMESEIE